MTWVGTLGLALIGVAVVGVAVVALAAVLPPALRLRRVALVTRGLVEEFRESVTAEVWTLREHELERAVLLRPVRRVRRVLTHPLTIALLESYARRRERAREAARA